MDESYLSDPVDTDFEVKFITRMFDCGTKQGLAVTVGGKLSRGAKRHAIAISPSSSPKEVAQALRGMADWIAAQSDQPLR